ncbi:MAG: spore protease YyaC [Bacillota bacterium]
MNIRCEISGGLYCAVAGGDVFPVVLFVGSDKVVGDALAPICGSLLKKMRPQCFIYGDLQNPVNAKNLQSTLDFIKAVHKGHKILVVDASIGKQCDVGKIKFVAGGISPGKAVGRNFDAVGDFSIIGIVAHRNEKTGGISPVRLFSVVEMAREIAREIYLCNRSFSARSNPQSKNQTSLVGICP